MAETGGSRLKPQVLKPTCGLANPFGTNLAVGRCHSRAGSRTCRGDRSAQTPITGASRTASRN